MSRPCLAHHVEVHPLRSHLPILGEQRGIPKRIVAPLALIGTPRKVSHEGILVEALYRCIYPAETDRFLDELAVRGKWFPGVLLVYHNRHFILLLMILGEPPSKLYSAEDRYLLHHTKECHKTLPSGNLHITLVFCKTLKCIRQR